MVRLDGDQPTPVGVGGDERAERRRREPDVGIEEQDVRTRGGQCSRVARPRFAQPPLRRRRGDDDDRAAGAGDARRAVLGPVIDDDDLLRGGVEGTQRCEQDRQRGRFVPSGNDDGHAAGVGLEPVVEAAFDDAGSEASTFIRPRRYVATPSPARATTRITPQGSRRP